MTLKPHTSYTVRQIKRPFFLASIPTKDGCSYVQLDHVEISPHVCPSRTSISSAQMRANESRDHRHPLSVNDQLAFQEAKGIAGKTPVRFALKPHVPSELGGEGESYIVC